MNFDDRQYIYTCLRCQNTDHHSGIKIYNQTPNCHLKLMHHSNPDDSSWNDNMHISVPGGGVDTDSEYHPQIPGFESRDQHDVIVRFC